MEDAKNAEEDLVERFRDYYVHSDHAVLRELEMRTLGADYGGNGYTDTTQVEHFVDLLRVGSDDRVLELGSGAGWPGVYISKVSGAAVVISDIPWEGVSWGLGRARADGIDAIAVACSGIALPFKDAMFDGVTHSDVLC
ncbi:MAG: class I SAM-dependent methyltransferase [Actinomycetia bacterium]|nr:class I SAM-dependent methyltransferase [Actinomycetes bacterium]